MNWRSPAHRERYAKVLNRQMTLEEALKETTADYRRALDDLEAIVNLSPEQKQQARAEAILRGLSDASL